MKIRELRSRKIENDEDEYDDLDDEN